MSDHRPSNELVARLREYLRYDPDTGKLFWLRNKGGRAKVGAVAGSSNNDGYILVKFDNRNIKAHRIAWALTYGLFPDGELDHINRDPADNRLSNLRQATREQNNRNVAARAVSGLMGAYKCPRGYYSLFSVGNRQRYLGFFKTAEEAHVAYLKARRAHELP